MSKLATKLMVANVIAAILMPFSTLSVFATERPNLTERAAQKEQFTQERCDLTKQKIDIVIARHELNSNKHKEIFGRIKERVTKFLDKMDEKGLDTTQARNELSQFETLKTDLVAMVEQKTSLLKEARNMQCGEDFRAKLKEARDMNPTIRAKHAEMKNYWLNTLKPTLKSLAQQAKPESEEETESENHDD